MICNRMLLRNFLLIVAATLAGCFSRAYASDTLPISGSYHILSHMTSGTHARVRLQLHLANRGPREIHVRRITPWDLSHPSPGGSLSCNITVHSGSYASATQEFLMPQAEYELWRHGTRPRVVLEIESPNGRFVTQAIRLEPKAARRGN